MQIKAINTTITITDMETSLAFYKALGFTEAARWGNHYAQLQLKNAVFGLHPSAKEKVSASQGLISIGLEVDDLMAATQLLEATKISFTSRREAGGLFIHFCDPDGNPLYFIKPNT
jgi:catechol 2,3-dioxygenase-like lactoylglutathione lyase family enzyme